MKKLGNWMIVLVLIGCVFFACWKWFLIDRIEEHRFFSHVIELPDTVLKIEAGKVCISALPNADLRMVYYFDSKECMECCVYHVYELGSMFTQKEFVTIPLFAPKQENMTDVISDIRKYGYVFPVYVMIDSSKDFINSIPDKVKYHNFLLYKDNIPIFIGDPARSAEDAERFDSIVQTYVQH